MNNDDESFLSAYMDGQLAPDQQQLVESALVANPQLAERLRGFTLLRDLVAGLPRDGSVDVSTQVMRQIHARGQRKGLVPTLARLRHGSRRILPLAGLAATAASLMVAASLAILIQTTPFDRGGQPVAALGRDTTVVQSSPTSITPPSDATVNSGAPAGPSSLSHTEISGALAKGIVAASTLTKAPSEPVADPSEPLANGDLEHVRQLLDNPDLKRFFLVRNDHKNNYEQQVASIVEHTTRFDFFKLTVSQGIVIDPRHPDEATVFAFVINPNQVDRFHEQLKEALPGLVELEALDPSIATQLADIGKVRAFPPASLAEVEIPREDLAFREQGGNTASRETSRPSARSERDADNAQGSEPSSGSSVATAKPSARARGAGSEPASLIGPSPSSDPVTVVRPPVRTDNRVVVLVWVCSRPAG